jgi:hypothetical protein
MKGCNPMALFQRRKRRPPGGGDPPSLGLVVGPKAVQLFDAKGVCIYDELVEREKVYRMGSSGKVDGFGRPPVIFIEDDDDPYPPAKLN